MKAVRFILPNSVTCQAYNLAQAIQCLPFDAAFQYAMFDKERAETSLVFTHTSFDDIPEGAEFPTDKFAVQSTGTIYLRSQAAVP